MKLNPEKRQKSAFTTIFSRYKFLIIPFGLAQGQAYFTVLMQKVLSTFKTFVSFTWMMYKYDSKKEDHLQNLKVIFMKIREAGLKLKLLRCPFVERHLKYLGHLISDKGFYPLKGKVALIVNKAPPMHVTIA